nr:hypothetical protein Itr_chr05CG11170 [Ipomoea trifida]
MEHNTVIIRNRNAYVKLEWEGKRRVMNLEKQQSEKAVCQPLSCALLKKRSEAKQVRGSQAAKAESWILQTPPLLLTPYLQMAKM